MINGSSDYQQILHSWQQQQEQKLQAAKDAATNAAKALKTRGITQVEFDYCGSGDSGCIENCHTEGTGKILEEERERLEDLVYELLPRGWEINEGSTGAITFDLQTGKVSLSHKWLEYVEDENISGIQLKLD